MCRPIKSVDVRQFATVADVLQAISDQLVELSQIAAETDFENPDHADQFYRNVIFLKTYYERCESLIRHEIETGTGQPLD
ncbi:hypothetical protein CCP4SC76_7630002 [Gammaproteobacteria bacterium]